MKDKTDTKGRTCSSCNKPMLAEALGDQKTKFVCEHCGVSEICDSRGCQLLTSERQAPGGSMLTG